jgi:hypothetical protein
MDRFKIFPSIGIARLGGSKREYFLCPEKSDSLGIEIGADSKETEIKNFKDGDGLIKRQGARFRVFELDEATKEYLPVDMSTISVEWKVSLANKKAAVDRSKNLPPNLPPDTAPQLPFALRPNHEELIIKGGEKTITGKNSNGVFFDSAKYKKDIVYLGELKTDSNGNLIVLGGYGNSKSPSNAPLAATPNSGFYFSDDWYDDTSDGYVFGEITLADGTKFQTNSSWIIVGPPDFAPGVRSFVSLYDIIEELFLPLPISTSFTKHIEPLISKFLSYKWVQNKDFSIPYTIKELSDNSAASKIKRIKANASITKRISELREFTVTSIQKKHIENWVNGDFINEVNTAENNLMTGDSLTKIVLDTTVGQGFFPGIEGGIVLRNKNIFSEPFRIKSTIEPGDITAMMALPWQADFIECKTNWWPTQRPQQVHLADGKIEEWDRNIVIGNNYNHKKLVDNFNKLGFVKPVGNEQIESERSL